MGKENQIQLKCSGCGAPITFLDKACPYCGKENKNSTEHIKTKERVEKETQETVKSLRTDNKRFTSILSVSLVLIALVVVILLFVFTSGHVDRYVEATDYRYACDHYDEFEDKLMTLWNNHDFYGFYGLSKLYDIAGYTSGPFAKYSGLFRIADCYTHINNYIIDYYMNPSIAGRVELVESVSGLLINFYDTQYMNMYGSKNGMSDAAVYKYFEPIYNQMRTIIQIYFGLSDEDAAKLHRLNREDLEDLLIEGINKKIPMEEFLDAEHREAY